MFNPCCWSSKGNLVSSRFSSQTKKVINFTPQYYAASTPVLGTHIAALQSVPIDGILLDFKWIHPTFGNITAQKSWMYSDVMNYPELQSQIDTINALDMGRLTHNFVRARLQPGVDSTTEFWNNPAMISASAINIGILAKAARATGCVGMMWDLEGYATDIQHKMLHYSDLKAGFTLDERKVQVRAGMKAMAQSIWENFPEAIVFMTFGYEEMYSSVNYDLLGAAIDGILDALPGSKFAGDDYGIPKLINGLEDCYYTDTEADFDYVFEEKAFNRYLAAGETFHPMYVKSLSMSPGIWIDRVTTAPWDTFSTTTTYDKNYYDPTLHRLRHASWQELMSIALSRSDMYVWIYSNNGTLGFPGQQADYHTAVANAVAAADMSRSRYNRRTLAYVSDAQKVAANAACAAIGLGSLFNTPLIDRGDSYTTAPKYWMANLHISEAEYRALKVVVGASATVRWAPQGNYNSSDVAYTWLLGQGKRLAGSIEQVGATDYLLLSSGDKLKLQNGNILLAA